MTLREKQSIFALNVATLIEYIYYHHHNVTFGEAYRTPEQARIYSKQGKGIVNSLHCKRLAIDLHIFNKEGLLLSEKSEYEPFGTYWKSLHTSNRWGGDFAKLVDSNHFEMKE